MHGIYGRLATLASMLTVAIPADAGIAISEERQIGERKPRNLGRPLNDPKLAAKEKSKSLKRMLKNKSRK